MPKVLTLLRFGGALLFAIAVTTTAGLADYPPPGGHSAVPKYWPTAQRWATNYTPHGYGDILDITPDGHGGVWFAQRQTVEHINANGMMRSFSIPEQAGEIRLITRDQRGRVWFSLGQSGRIGTISDEGKMRTEVLIQRAESPDIGDLAFDARGNLWFIDDGRSSLGVRTPAGTVIERRRFDFDTSTPAHLTLCGDTMYFFVDIIPNSYGGTGNARYGLSGLYAVTMPNLRVSLISKFSIFAQTDSTVVTCDRSNRLWYALSGGGWKLGELRDVGYMDGRRQFHDMPFTVAVDAAGSAPDGSVWLCGFGSYNSLPKARPRRLRCEQYLGHVRVTSIVMPFSAFISQSVGIDAAETLWFGLSWPFSILQVSR